jgi:hypothetical protein
MAWLVLPMFSKIIAVTARVEFDGQLRAPVARRRGRP